MFWKKIKNQRKPFKCPKCHKVHDELPALGFDEPHHYGQLNGKDKELLAELSSDFCTIRHPEQTDRFVRTYLRMQIDNACEDLDYGVWVSVSEKTYNEYSRDFENKRGGNSYFGRIANEIQDYEESTIGIHVNIETQPDGIRPEVIPHKSDHSLVREWEQGISIEEAEKRVNKLTNDIG